MLNQCNFIGRVGKDPDSRFTPSGVAVTTFSIAVSEKYKDRDGNKQEKTEWINVVFWRKLAEIVSNYVKKGDLIFISGKITTRTYDDRDGNKKYITEIVANEMKMLGSRQDGDQDHGQKSRTQNQNSRPQQQTFEEPVFDPGSEIPF